MLSSKTVSARDLSLHYIEVEQFVSTHSPGPPRRMLTRRTFFTNREGDEGEGVGGGEHDLSVQMIKSSFALQF